MTAQTANTPREMGAKVIEFLRGLPAKLGRRAVVLVPREPVAHELRRQILAEKEGAGLLCGVRFLTQAAFGAEVCAVAGKPLQGGLEQTWTAALDFLIHAGRPDGLRYFKLDSIIQHDGYPRAIATTLFELEKNGLDANHLEKLSGDLPRTVGNRIRDLVVLRQALNEELEGTRQSFVTSPQLVRAAVACLQKNKRTKVHFGQVCAVAIGTRNPELRSLLPVLDAAPVILRGEQAARLPHKPEVSLHGGVENELEAALTWVEREMVEHHTPLGQIAVLCAQPQLLLPMARRLARLVDEKSIVLAGGVPVSTSVAGSLAMLGLDAVLEHLPREGVADFAAGVSDSMSISRAVREVSELGILGGEPGAWRDWDRRVSGGALKRALQPLIKLSRLIESEATLEDLETGVRGLFNILPDKKVGATLIRGLEEIVSSLAPARALLSGQRGLRHLRDALSDIKTSLGRFGMPQVFVGPPESAAGLSFTALRLIGLAEGSIPPNPGEDPVLPDSDRRILRERLPKDERELLPLRQDHIQDRREAADLCLSAAESRLSASASVQQIDTQQLEPSTYLLEMAAEAVGKTGALPTSGELWAESEKNLNWMNDWRNSRPRYLARLASRINKDSGTWSVPSSWIDNEPENLKAILDQEQACEADSLDAAEGLIPSGTALPGLQPENPLSSTRLQVLLGCPLRFAREVVLRLDSPDEFPSPWELDPMTKGTTLHRVSEHFFNKCGGDFLKKKDSSGFSKDAAKICREEFKKTAETYALDGERIRKKQLEHLEELTLRVLAYYEKTEASGFEGAEVPLGDPSVPIDTPAGKLFLKGTADLILRSRRGRIVHDLKSGTAHPFGSNKELEVGKDLQPLIYEICLSAAGDRDIAEAGLVYPSGGPGGIGRLLSGKDLERGRDWCLRCIAVARQLLGAGAFAPLPDDIACTYCSHECANEDLSRVRKKVEELAGSSRPRTDSEEALVALWTLRHEEDDGDE